MLFLNGQLCCGNIQPAANFLIFLLFTKTYNSFSIKSGCCVCCCYVPRVLGSFYRHFVLVLLVVCVSVCFTRQGGFCDLSRQLIGGSTADWDLELRPLVRGCSWLGFLKSPVLDQFFLPVPAVGLVCTLCGGLYDI